MSIHRGRIVCKAIPPSLRMHLKESIQTAAGSESRPLSELDVLSGLHDGGLRDLHC